MIKVVCVNDICCSVAASGHFFNTRCASLIDQGLALYIASRSSLEPKLNLKIFSPSFSMLTLSLILHVLEMISVSVYLRNILVRNILVFKIFPKRTFSVMTHSLTLGCRENELSVSCKDFILPFIFSIMLFKPKRT